MAKSVIVMAAVISFAALAFAGSRQDKPVAVKPTKGVATGPERMAPINERFASLRDYLAWAKAKRFIDVPWYEETKPGVFKFHPSRGRRPAKIMFTESELKEKFGFDR